MTNATQNLLPQKLYGQANKPSAATHVLCQPHLQNSMGSINFQKVHWPNSEQNTSLTHLKDPLNNCFESCGKAKRASRGNFLLPTKQAATELEKSKNLLHNVERMKYIINMLYPSRQHQLLLPAPLLQYDPKKYMYLIYQNKTDTSNNCCTIFHYHTQRKDNRTCELASFDPHSKFHSYCSIFEQKLICSYLP